MNVEWTPREKPVVQAEYEYRATFEGLVLIVVHDRYGVRWTVVGRLNDFNLSASAHVAKTVDEAKTAALSAARRLRQLGVEGLS